MPTHYYYDTAEGIEEWLRLWEDELLKKPEEIILGRSLRNVLNLILGELRSLSAEKRAKGIIERSEKGQVQWAREMLLLLEQEFVRDPHGRIAMLRRHYPDQTNALEQQIRKGSFSIGDVEAAIGAFLEVDWFEPLFHELGVELGRGKGYDEERLHVISHLLLEVALPRFSDSELKQLPRRTLIREYTTVLLAENTDDVLASSTLAPAFDGAVNWVLAENRLSLDAASVATSPDLFGLYETFLWKALAYEFLRSVADALNEAQNRAVPTQDGESEEVHASAMGLLAKQLAQSVLDLFVHILYRHSLHVFLGTQLKGDRPTPFTVFAAQLLEVVAQACHLGDVRREQDESRSLGPLTDAVYMSLPGVLSRALCESASVSLDAIAIADLIEPFRLLSEWLSSEIQAAWTVSSQGAGAADQEELAKHSQDIASSRRFQEKLWPLLKPFAGILADKPTAARVVVSQPTAFSSSGELAGFWPRWQAVFPEYAESFPVFHYLPWNLASQTHIARGLEALAGEMRKPGQDWWVYFRAEGLSLEDARCSIGRVHLYDPGSFDFGERQPFFSGRQANEDVTGIRVDISAPSRHAAQTAARVWAEEAVDVLSLTLSREQEGINPRILPRSLATPRSSPDRWFSDEFAPPSSQVRPSRKIQAPGLRVLEAYSPLLARHQVGTPAPTEIQAAFVRALRWYRKGRWKDDPDERFLLHWIALEHFFVGGKEAAKEATLLDVVPRAYTTWRSALQDFWPMWVEEWAATVKAIKDRPGLLASVFGDPATEGWDHYYYMLFHPDTVSRLAAYAQAEGSSAPREIQSWVDSVRQLDTEAIRSEVSRLREMCKYRLHLMWARRNALVHEARAFGPAADMEVYAQELQRILEIVLRNVAVEATSPSPMCQTIDEFIRLANLPWPEA